MKEHADESVRIKGNKENKVLSFFILQLQDDERTDALHMILYILFHLFLVH